MKLSTNLIFQLLSFVVQYGANFTAILPPNSAHWVSLVVGVAQAIVAWKAHNSNPDGTAAAK